MRDLHDSHQHETSRAGFELVTVSLSKTFKKSNGKTVTKKQTVKLPADRLGRLVDPRALTAGRIQPAEGVSVSIVRAAPRGAFAASSIYDDGAPPREGHKLDYLVEYLRPASENKPAIWLAYQTQPPTRAGAEAFVRLMRKVSPGLTMRVTTRRFDDGEMPMGKFQKKHGKG